MKYLALLLLTGCTMTVHLDDESVAKVDRMLAHRIDQIAVDTGLYSMSPEADKILDRYDR